MRSEENFRKYQPHHHTYDNGALPSAQKITQIQNCEKSFYDKKHDEGEPHWWTFRGIEFNSHAWGGARHFEGWDNAEETVPEHPAQIHKLEDPIIHTPRDNIHNKGQEYLSNILIDSLTYQRHSTQVGTNFRSEEKMFSQSNFDCRNIFSTDPKFVLRSSRA